MDEIDDRDDEEDIDPDIDPLLKPKKGAGGLLDDDDDSEVDSLDAKIEEELEGNPDMDLMDDIDDQ